ncbi:MAG TPA: response regulator transcription factor [Candidatus Acidoferrales bacterium]|jgi:DNA-binding NarL/FixJ family response regulator|nr:response regulator transcription factor [Candidatus Acidoferrales bacterium]
MARILIADDHPQARRGAREVLEMHQGWEVCGEAVNGLEAIEKAAALKPDIVIIDLSMPRMSGVQVARVIHSTTPQLPLLLFSLYAGDPQMADGFRAAGFSGDVNKAAANLLIEAVETLLRGSTYFQSSAVPRAIATEEAASQTEPPPVAPTAAAPAPQSSSDPPAAPADATSTNLPETTPGSATEPC